LFVVSRHQFEIPELENILPPYTRGLVVMHFDNVAEKQRWRGRSR
jgi:hypothetical protein